MAWCPQLEEYNAWADRVGRDVVTGKTSAIAEDHKHPQMPPQGGFVHDADYYKALAAYWQAMCEGAMEYVEHDTEGACEAPLHDGDDWESFCTCGLSALRAAVEAKEG
jgi:hypothetical protein